MSRGGSYECDVRKRPSWTFTSLCQWFEGEAWCRHSGSFAQSQTISVLIISRERRWVNAGWATQMPTRWTHLYLFLTCLFASRWCCSLFTHNHRATWQHMLPCSPTDMCSTLLKGKKKKSRLVPELGQMFEINGNFLVFFELGQMRGEKRKKPEFLYRMSLGCSAITLTCAPALVSPHWTEPDIVFHCSVLLQLLGGCRWAQCWDFIVVEHGGSGCLGQVSLQAWTAVGGDVPASSFGSGTTVRSLHSLSFVLHVILFLP